jgi:hypothetical protein
MLHAKFGNRWNDFCRYIKGKSANQLKNHFYSNFRKCIKRVNRKAFETDDEIDFLQSCYIIEFLVSYFSMPRQSIKKNYMHHFIVSNKIKLPDVQAFQQRLFIADPVLFQKFLEYRAARSLHDIPRKPPTKFLTQEEKSVFIDLCFGKAFLRKDPHTIDK